MNSLNSFKTNKFKKGDKVICVGNTSALGVEFGEVYTVDNPSSHGGFYNGELHNHVTLVEVESTPSVKVLELYVENRNYREMNPNDLITISVDGMNNQPYFTASSIQTMQGWLGQLGVRVDYPKHKEANVLILLGTGVYLLASVNALERSCKTYLSDKDTTMQVDVLDIMKVTQQSVCWCEL